MPTTSPSFSPQQDRACPRTSGHRRSAQLARPALSGAERAVSSDTHLQLAMVWRRSPSRGSGVADEEEKVPKGHIPMVAGGGGEGREGERVLVPVRLLSDPSIAELLDMAAQLYGYCQPGVLRIPCDAGHFRRVVDGAMQRRGIISSA